MKLFGKWLRNVSNKSFYGFIFYSFVTFAVWKISFQYTWKFFSNLIIMVVAVMASDVC